MSAITPSATSTEPVDLNESVAYVPITVVAVVLGVATLAVSLRVYARAVMIRQFGYDDWAAVVALVLAIGSGIMVATSMCSLIRILSRDVATDRLPRHHLWTWPTHEGGHSRRPRKYPEILQGRNRRPR